MAVELMQAFMETDLPPAERLTGIVLANHHNAKTGQCNPSVARLARMTGLSERTVVRTLGSLERLDHIAVIRRTGARSSYTLHPVPGGQMENSEGSGNPCHDDTPDTMSPLTPCHP